MAEDSQLPEITNADLQNRTRRARRSGPKEHTIRARILGWQRELKDVIESHLAREAGRARESVSMTYAVTEIGAKKYMFRYGMRIEGWPSGVPFDSPGAIRKPEQLCELLRRFRSGKTRFVRMGEAELGRLAAAHGSESVHSCMHSHRAWREDMQSGAQVRRADALSKKMARRRPRKIKTAAVVVDAE